MTSRGRLPNGYIYVYGPSGHSGFEHRIVYERYYLCCLLPWTDIHHINGKRDDNRIENLQAMLRADHSRKTIEDRNYRRQYISMWEKKCPRCTSEYMVKMGVYDGKQRYLCRDCGKTSKFIHRDDRDEFGHYLSYGEHDRSCPRCNSQKIIRFGSGRGVQRFKCKDCARDFI